MPERQNDMVEMVAASGTTSEMKAAAVLDSSQLSRLGLSAAALDELVARAEREVEEGPLPSLQLAVACRGELVLSSTVGDADPDGRYCIYSCVKPLVSSLVWRLLDQGLLQLDMRVN